MAYIAAVSAHTGFTARFQNDLSTPGLRIPLTASGQLFAEAAELGRDIIWLFTFGERMVDAKKGRPPGPPRLPAGLAPQIPAAGAISDESTKMPDVMKYDASNRRLYVGNGYVKNVDPRVWSYAVSGKHVLTQWFSYRKADRERPIIGERRMPSVLGNIQPDHGRPSIRPSCSMSLTY